MLGNVRHLATVLVVLLASHAGLGWLLHYDRPPLGILPPLPSPSAVRALSFGDAQLLYRAFVLQIQNAGDSGGQFTPMTKYDIGKVVDWFHVLQRLDALSSHYPALAVRYYSQIKSQDDLRKLVEFVDQDVDLAPDRKWYWQTQAVAMARDRLNDLPYALQLSRKLANFAPYLPEGYIWVLQVEPALLADLGRSDEAGAAMNKVIANYTARMNEAEKLYSAQFHDRLNNWNRKPSYGALPPEER